jgi:phosphatidate cytidylyltransferase
MVVFCLYYGSLVTLVFIILMGLLVLDELYCNFFAGKRKSIAYLFSIILYLIPVIVFGYLNMSEKGLYFGLYANLGLNLFLLIYLFFTQHDSNLLVNYFRKNPIWAFAIISLPILSLCLLLKLENWLLMLVLLFLINFGMDTGAWFFGKKFGKHKLLPAVSPKKTVEGLFGGMFVASLIGYFFWKKFLFVEESWTFICFFPLLAALSQMGDLVQSKLKRQFGLKDSSALIPGHGGVYDRVDGLVFLTPFFMLVANIYYS